MPRKHSRKGGSLGSLINQAIVPFGILGLQQTYKKRKNGGKKTRRRGRKGSRRRRH
jgi:hypothetical protein